MLHAAWPCIANSKFIILLGVITQRLNRRDITSCRIDRKLAEISSGWQNTKGTAWIGCCTCLRTCQQIASNPHLVRFNRLNCNPRCQLVGWWRIGLLNIHIPPFRGYRKPPASPVKRTGNKDKFIIASNIDGIRSGNPTRATQPFLFGRGIRGSACLVQQIDGCACILVQQIAIYIIRIPARQPIPINDTLSPTSRVTAS